MREKVHISQVKCWKCVHLQRVRFNSKEFFGSYDYKCIRNKVIPEYLAPDFAEKCTDYKPTKEVKK